jgi:hypothetical protein
MTLPRTVADVLADHVVFEIECIDRMYCNVYVPQLQHAGGLLGYIHRQLGLPIASTAPLGKITDAFSAVIRRFAREQRVPWVDFGKGQRKDDVMHEHLARFDGEEGVLFIGRAQEKTHLFRTERRRDAHGESYPGSVKTTGVVNQFYVYAVDVDFGPFFLKFCSYFPYNAKLCLLTELGDRSYQVRGRMRVRLARVRAHDRTGRAVTGSERVVGWTGRLAAEDRGSVRALPAA